MPEQPLQRTGRAWRSSQFKRWPGARAAAERRSVMPPEDGSLGEDEKWSSAAFRAWSAEVPPEEIVAALGLQPTKMFRKGDPYSRRSTSIRQNHLIVVEAAVPARESLERHLIALCHIIEPVAAKLPAIADRCGYDIFCGFSSGNQQGGFTLSPDLLKRLAALKIQFALDLYPPASVPPEA